MAQGRRHDFVRVIFSAERSRCRWRRQSHGERWRRDYDASGVGGGTPRVRGPVCVQQGGQDYTLTCREPCLQGGGFHVCSPSVTMIRRK